MTTEKQTKTPAGAPLPNILTGTTAAKALARFNRLFRLFRSARNRRRNSRIPFLGESMAWFAAPNRRS